jgi:hypothetical protein
VSELKALVEIQELAGRNFIRFSSHASKRMSQRGVTRRDVCRALLTATAATWQTDHPAVLILSATI